MPDTKSGREKKGLNKEKQLTEELYEQEMTALDGADVALCATKTNGEAVSIAPRSLLLRNR